MKTFIVSVQLDGTMSEFEMDQKDLHTLVDGGLTFVGAIESLDAFLVSSESSCETDSGGIPSILTRFVDMPCFGPVFIVGSDTNGKEKDVRLADVQNLLAQQ